MLNINYGYNQLLMNKCKVLEEYARFVDISRQFIQEEQDRQKALNDSVDYCIEHDILSEFLKKYRAEVLGMLLEQFDVKKYERSLRAEGFEEGQWEGFEKGHQEGIQEGLEKGHQEGVAEGAQRINKLTSLLLAQNRMADLERSLRDPDYQNQLLREFDLL